MSKSDSDDEAQHEDQMTSSAALNTNAAVQAAFAGDLSAIETLYGQDLLSGRLPEVLSSANVQLCAAAAKNGHLHILKRWDVVQWLRNPGGDQLPCASFQYACSADLDGTMCNAAAAQGDIGMLTWLRAQGCCWGAASEAAFQNAQVDTLFWIQSQKPPCRWTGPTTAHADDKLAAAMKASTRSDKETADRAAFLDLLVLRCLIALWGGLWMRQQEAMYISKLVAESGRLGPMLWLMKNEYKDWPKDAGTKLFISAVAANQPTFPHAKRQLIHLCKIAAEFGQLEMLRWLLSGDNSSIKTPASVCQRAAKYDQPEVVQWLLAHRSRARLTKHPEVASDRCFIMLARAGCPIPDFHSNGRTCYALRRMFHLYYTLMGLVKYAKHKGKLDDDSADDVGPFDPEVTRRAGLPLVQHNAEGCKQFNSLWHMSNLPADLLSMIVEDVCISPRLVSKFRFRQALNQPRPSIH
ncbi:hypothetical protein WJX74_010580 [Apatococcus lobatus]|uniref:Ankyrin repeat protein n=1 Tax=Apatococcus lobatus TaxID=904363 RepID=A0AAW1RM74_9CHLO